MRDALSRLVGRSKQRSAPGSTEHSPDNSPRTATERSAFVLAFVLFFFFFFFFLFVWFVTKKKISTVSFAERFFCDFCSGSPRKSSLLDPRNRSRSRSVVSFNNSPRTAASLEYLWLLRPETRASVEQACTGDTAKRTDTTVSFVERCLFSNRISEQDKVRELAYVSPALGGAGVLLRVALETFSKYEKGDRQTLGQRFGKLFFFLLSHLTRTQLSGKYLSMGGIRFCKKKRKTTDKNSLFKKKKKKKKKKKGPSLSVLFHELVARICLLIDDGEQWQGKISTALEHASKTYR